MPPIPVDAFAVTFGKLWRQTTLNSDFREREFCEKVAARFNWSLAEAYAQTATFRALHMLGD